jgi:hypothetical protein
MSDKLTIFLTPNNRRMAADAVHKRPDGHMLVLQERTRSNHQNALLHHLFGVAAKHAKFHGRTLTPTQWKVLFISGHAIASGIGADMIPGLEGEFVNIRESSAQMGVRRMNSLLEYVQAWMTTNDIPLSAPPGYEDLAA